MLGPPDITILKQTVKTLNFGSGYTSSFDQYDYGESFLPFLTDLPVELTPPTLEILKTNR